MRYGKGHKEQTRQKIVEAAAQRFRADGIDAVGVVSLMGEVGLTQGGFYNHFESKEELVRESVAVAATGAMERMAARVAASRGERYRALINAYLSAEHRDNPESGCVAAALSAEMARRPVETREAFTDGYAEMVELIASTLPDGVRGKRRRTLAMAVFASMVGSLSLARAVAEDRLSDEILSLGRQSALELVQAG
ncbi:MULTISPECIES: TetR/AcrR family transcriptional regulator [unclassified Luteibacter]|uniref:TetR/AcrR family transcriptional regulator n=1 Tax=unclassified Luteibacter TaxID=2620188 RepID=UPI0008B38DD4|nr:MULTISPECIES: TetR/AcrR family transcriptional regulator [unclassified Luteibacter]MDR6937426.1 TetR/AcrR family transcriptional repressor of nem operon [Luteibacter sp. 3190]SEO33484.1 transcriptional regulator, TetR family [Luteibacter sp. UNC138MFCol5.1]SEW24713.1 transcriptional regulator, TetR family [Luteibacter sp. 329MFSha]